MQQGGSQQQEPLLVYRVENVEKELAQVKMQLNLYETTRENELKVAQSNLKLQAVVDTIADIKSELSKIKDELTDIKKSVVSQDKSSTEQNNNLSKSIKDVQIRVLLWFVLWFLGIVGSIFIGYVNHVFH